MGYYRKIIGGIILIIFGIPAIGISSWLQNEASTVLSYCNSLSGLPRFLAPEDCSNASLVSSASLVGLLIGGLMILIGIILLIVGIVRGKKPKVIESNKLNQEKKGINPISNEIKNSKESQVNIIYCRYCGKTKPLESQYCPRCGKSSISKFERLIDCNNCHSLISEDSRYCSSCGHDIKEDYHRSPI
jgi:RNA polymerase subunit RPABC4/transcription elongation factor Spt4